MLTFDKYLSKVNEAIAEIQYPKEPSGLYEPIAYTMALGGKRIRPILTLMTYDAFTNGDCTYAINPAIGIEMYHNFTLLHDDVMDRAPIRRGKPTVHVKWNESTAILSGDAMLTMATQLVCKAPLRHLDKAQAVFNSTAMKIYEGQQYDMDFESRSDVSVAEYVAMIFLKTSVLLGCACKMGAILSSTSDENADQMYEFGANLGLAFQLQDDLLDVYGDSATFGKAIGGDILNNKKTFLLISALNRATGKDAEELQGWLNVKNPNKEEKIKGVTDIYNRLGVREVAEAEINRYIQKSLYILDSINMSDRACEAFHEFVDMLMNRTK